MSRVARLVEQIENGQLSMDTFAKRLEIAVREDEAQARETLMAAAVKVGDPFLAAAMKIVLK